MFGRRADVGEERDAAAGDVGGAARRPARCDDRPDRGRAHRRHPGDRRGDDRRRARAAGVRHRRRHVVVLDGISGRGRRRCRGRGTRGVGAAGRPGRRRRGRGRAGRPRRRRRRAGCPPAVRRRPARPVGAPRPASDAELVPVADEPLLRPRTVDGDRTFAAPSMVEFVDGPWAVRTIAPAGVHLTADERWLIGAQLAVGAALAVLAIGGMIGDHRALQRRATTDALTQLPNRAEFERRATETLARLGRDRRPRLPDGDRPRSLQGRQRHRRARRRRPGAHGGRRPAAPGGAGLRSRRSLGWRRVRRPPARRRRRPRRPGAGDDDRQRPGRGAADRRPRADGERRRGAVPRARHAARGAAAGGRPGDVHGQGPRASPTTSPRASEPHPTMGR